MGRTAYDYHDDMLRARMALRRAERFAKLAARDAAAAKATNDESKAFSARMYWDRVHENRDNALRRLKRA